MALIGPVSPNMPNEKSKAQMPINSPLGCHMSQALIEHLPVGVYLCDQTAVLVGYNNKAAEIWGEAPNLGDQQRKFCGAHKLLTSEGAYVPYDQTPLAQVLIDQVPILDISAIVERRDGSRVPVLANVIPLFDESETMIGFMNCVTDMRTQAAQQQEKDQLAEQLFQSQKMELIGQLTSGLSHDFKNQLGSVVSALSLMEKEISAEGSERLQRRFQLARQATDQAVALAADLLNFARKRPRVLVHIEANNSLLSLAPLFRSTLGSAVRLSLDLASEPCDLKANQQQFDSALLNLVLNARDAMPDGGTLTISSVNVELGQHCFPEEASFAAGKYVRISVADTGSGIKQDELSEIFTPFFSTKTAGGTGMGLSMVRGFLSDVHGYVMVQSEVGKGTRFALYFPCYG